MNFSKSIIIQKFILPLILLLSCAFSFSQNIHWGKSMGSKGQDVGASVVVDTKGNVYSTGFFSDTADFDPGPKRFQMTTAGGDDIFISKVDFAGNFVWAKRIGGKLHEFGKSITCDVKGNIYILGQYSGTVDFDPGAGNANLTSSQEQGFLLKLNSAGNFLWVKRCGENGSSTGTNKVILDGSENIYVAGFYYSTCDFDPGSSSYNLTSKGGRDIFISKYNSSGNLLWAKSAGGTGDFDDVLSIALDRFNNVYTTGVFIGKADFDPGVDSFFLNSGGLSSYILKLSSSGNFLWATQMKGNNWGRSIFIDKFSNVYSTGDFYGTVDFDPGAGQFNLSASGNNDIYISKLDSNGKFIWANRIGGSSLDYGSGISTDDNGSVYITGSFDAKVDFDPGSAVYNLDGYNHDIFILKLSDAGKFIWARRLTSGGIDEAFSIVIDNKMNIYLTGKYYLELYGDDGTGFTKVLEKAQGDDDIFILKLGVCDFSLFSGTRAFEVKIDSNVRFPLILSGTPWYFTWEADTGTGFKEIFDDSLFSGTSNDTLTITGVKSFHNKTKYRCVVTGKKCAVISDTFLLTVKCELHFKKQPENLNSIAGSNAKFSIVSSNLKAKYQWQRDTGTGFNNIYNGINFSGAQKDTLKINFLTKAWNNYAFRCLVSDKGCSDTSNPANLKITCDMIIADHPQNKKADAGNTSFFNIRSSNSKATYQWQINKGAGFIHVINDGQYSGNKGDTLFIKNLNFQQNKYNFRCIASFAGCADTSIMASLEVNCNLKLTGQPANQSKNVGVNAFFNVKSSNSKAAYQWQINKGNGFINVVNDIQYSGNTGDTLFIKNIRLIQNKYYIRCIASYAGCADTSSVAVLEVHCVSALVDQPENQSKNIGEDALFFITATNQKGTMQWQKKEGTEFMDLSESSYDKGVKNDTFIIKNVSLSQHNSVYRCILLDGECSDTSDEAVLSVTTNKIRNSVIEKNFIIYPNPVNKIITIQSNNARGELPYRIVDKSGRQILSGSLSNRTSMVDISELAGGFYFLEIGNSFKETYMLIKQ